MNDWLKPPQRDIPLVYGPAPTTLGYYALEEASRENALRTMSGHQRETALWYRALTLHLQAQDGNWTPLPTPKGEQFHHAQTAQIDLLALGLCSSKAALDLILAGYYSIAWAAIRHCAEVTIHCQYLAHFPSTYWLWYARDDEKQKPPKCRQMVDQLKKEHKSNHGSSGQAYADFLESTYKLWHLMSAGSHPTGEGLTELQDMEERGPRYWGSNYRYDLTMVSVPSVWCSDATHW